MELIDLLSSIFTDYTLRNVASGAAVLGVVTGALGSFALLRKQSLIGDAMSHAALPGVVLVFILTGLKTPLALLAGAFVTAWLGALLVMLVTSQTRIKQDSGLGIVLAVLFGLGLALLSWVRSNAGANQSGLDKYLFGQAAAIVQQDVLVMAVVGGIAVFLMVLFWKEFKLLTFDDEFAAAIGFPVRFLNALLNTLTVIAVVVGLQMVGVVLMAAMVVAPAAAARQWTDKLSVMVLLASIFGAISGVSGALISSVGRGLSTGPVIVLVISGVAFLSILVAPNRGVIPAWWRTRQNRKKLGTRRVMEALYILGTGHNDPTYPHSERNLRASLPTYNVAGALQELLAGELAVHSRDQHGRDMWALTGKGVAEIESHLKSTHAVEGATVKDTDHAREVTA